MSTRLNRAGLLLAGSLLAGAGAEAQSAPLRIATFQTDATPPLGTALIVRHATSVRDSLQVRGVVLLGGELPIVLVAVDWLGIGNGAHAAWRAALAEAAGTSPDRVAVHTLHQHDAPDNDFDAELILLAHGRHGRGVTNADFARETIRRTAEAIRQAIPPAAPVTHLGAGRAAVDSVASNRRLHGPDGRVAYVRFSQTAGRAELRALPEDLIDPDVRVISFWEGSRPLAALTYYATHPQSYYGQGELSYDFVGMAREQRQRETGVFHVHFNGAGGNVAAGKYNDGSRENRPVLAARLEAAMEEAWRTTQRRPVSREELGWEVRPVVLPPSSNLNRDSLVAALPTTVSVNGAAERLAFLNRAEKGTPVLIGALRLGDTRVLHMPGELFVEYQLSAQSMRPDLFVAMAAYGDYGPGYIGTRVAYPEGGYEVGYPSKVSPDAEEVLTRALRELLEAPAGTGTPPSEFTRRQPRYPPPTPTPAGR